MGSAMSGGNSLKRRAQKPEFILGIDPARGWAVVQRRRGDKSVLECGAESGLQALKLVLADLTLTYIFDEVRIEKPNNRNVWPRPGVSAAALRKIAVNIGENRNKADVLISFFREHGCKNIIAIPPIRNGTKLSKERIEAMTGYSGRSSEHSRDAIMLAWV